MSLYSIKIFHIHIIMYTRIYFFENLIYTKIFQFNWIPLLEFVVTVHYIHDKYEVSELSYLELLCSKNKL